MGSIMYRGGGAGMCQR